MVLFSFVGSAFDFVGMSGVGDIFIIVGIMGLVWGVLVLVGAIMMNSSNPSRVKTGAVLVLVFSIISWFGAAGGFVIGFILGLIGAILGLVWHPSTHNRVPPPPP